MKTEIKKGYKVVDITTGKLRSFVFDKEHTGWAESFLIYKPGKWTHPKPYCGPIALFSDKTDALKMFLRHKRFIKLYSCLYEPSEEKDLWCEALGHSNLDDIIRDFYPGTILAKKVKLIREVTYGNKTG